MFISVNFIPLTVYCNLKIALFGDSLMAGYGLSKKYHLSTILQKNLEEQGFDVDVINASVSGDTTAGGLNRLNWLVDDNNIDIIILCLGANDMLRGISPNTVKENLKKILENLKKKKLR